MKDAQAPESEGPDGGRSRVPQLGEVLEFMRLLWAVDHGLQSTSKRMESTLGLTGPQRLVIRLVGRFPGITAGTLAQILHVHPSTLTGVLKRLEKRGLLERKSDPLDGRKALFALTDAGRTLDVPSEGTVESAVQRVLARMPRDRIVFTQEVLTALAEELGGIPMAEDGVPAIPTAGPTAEG
ncbi:MarR family transcriptional regulator [Corallococcus praedator]|uniref:MarR family transcriptional regulator n=1 Tax=Corallococcus praedator TaxID=2316724 RepID=A0ABX9Q4U5_9BACT|nr:MULTISPECIES: MarR family transcriptional regulator [Corallococcus]RKG95515.1 MarR family transcriptional regulator [Corallococcus sp. CA047B]RKH18211.1 MarR family transcriptional regulator [Corallococcus sp. CA031C]RKH91194.1 MarR family transcriptional regulator [Corallococcus praedator]